MDFLLEFSSSDRRHYRTLAGDDMLLKVHSGCTAENGSPGDNSGEHQIVQARDDGVLKQHDINGGRE